MTGSLPLAGLILFSLLSGISATYAVEADAPPKAAVREVSDTYFGTRIVNGAGFTFRQRANLEKVDPAPFATLVRPTIG